MNKKIRSALISGIAGIVAAGIALPALAGGPLNLNPNDPDNFTRWAAGGVDIPYNPDLGGLGPLNQTDAVQFVTDAYQAWADIPTATATYLNAGSLPFDVDETNFAPFIDNLFNGNNNSDGFSPIVFDEDGAIFDTLFGPGSGVLGFASADTFDGSGVPIEGVSFLNGGSILGGFPLADFFGVFVHEFGHYSGLAHTVVNGQNIALGDTSGPTPNNTYGNAPLDQVETMYPFAIIDGGESTPHADDIGFFSTLYPEASFFANSATMGGTIFAPNGTTPITGVNVIARNVADPFVDAVSAISGDRGVTGDYTINGLTPGASYEVFVDQILQGGFSTPPIALPGVEEFYNGVNESNDGATDIPTDAVAVVTAAGATSTGIDVLFNGLSPGTPIPLGDDDSVEVFLPFTFNICGRGFDSAFINSNGSVTFGAGDTDFSETTGEFLQGPPRIAGLWDDLSPNQGGTVHFEVGAGDSSWSAVFTDVPEFGFPTGVGANSFEIVLMSSHSIAHVNYGDVSAPDGIVGVSCGIEFTSGFEAEINVSMFANMGRTIKVGRPAAYELFDADDFDLDSEDTSYRASKTWVDRHEPDDSFAQARIIPGDSYDTINVTRDFSFISPAGNDVDFFTFEGTGGRIVTVDLIAGGIDSILGLFDSVGNLLAVDDDGKGTVGGLSIIDEFLLPADDTYFIAVSTWPDFDFDGLGGLGGEGRYVMVFEEADAPTGVELFLSGDGSEEIPLFFDFPYQGAIHNSVFVNANGSLTFGGGDSDWTESSGEFLSGLPRIAPLWDDLEPDDAGTVFVDYAPGVATVTFTDVPKFLQLSETATFSVTMVDTGEIIVNYGNISAGIDGLAGVTEGGGAADPGAVDLSSSAFWPLPGTTYEVFPNPGDNDLSLSTIIYGAPP